VLFQSRFHDPIRRGEITRTVRIWKRPRVRIGGVYGLGAGAITVERIDEVEFDALTPTLARSCGFGSLVDLLKVAKHGAGERVFLIEFHYIDKPPERSSRENDIGEAAVAEVIRKLDAMDKRAQRPWTRETLQAIAAQPGRRAGHLAAQFGRERLEFKADVRKLKALGLTISLEVGYRLSTLGEALLNTEPSSVNTEYRRPR
jgi:hypothetical protein